MKIVFALIVLAFLCACSKNSSSSNNLLGTWIFTKETSKSYNWSPTSDSMTITFDNSNHYVYRSYSSFPVDNGTYSISKDSIITFTPDSLYSPFFYLLHNLFISPGPDTAWHFIGEKIYFKTNANQLILTSTWTELLGAPPDTIPAENNFYFKSK